MTSEERKRYRILLTMFQQDHDLEVGQVPPSVMTGTDELPLFRGLEGEQRWKEDYHKR
jgi:hypothetical protein